jgi:hypothetical protein
MSKGLDKLSTEKSWNFLFKAKKCETTCILHECFSSILKNYLMIVRPDLQSKSPYFHGLWYFYLILVVSNNDIVSLFYFKWGMYDCIVGKIHFHHYFSSS